MADGDGGLMEMGNEGKNTRRGRRIVVMVRREEQVWG